VEEVLARQPEPVQTFLLQTAILERLEGSLCEAVMGVMREPGGEASGQAMLEQVEQANLFLTPLDDSRRWYRYHQLFAEALRHRLQRRQPDLIIMSTHLLDRYVYRVSDHCLFVPSSIGPGV